MRNATTVSRAACIHTLNDKHEPAIGPESEPSAVFTAITHVTSGEIDDLAATLDDFVGADSDELIDITT